LNLFFYGANDLYFFLSSCSACHVSYPSISYALFRQKHPDPLLSKVLPDTSVTKLA